mmetsp:Transcript_17097/g.28558  ORF Transcript_17097/g.28558 Transcript_17097/m.28558 type:complete len:555 (+) Transcript_17097:56-1720(+)|eukprot:CAMPEP_0114419220 /NCGR_PEP_ID=MMETSP0103-20121206/3912_1 /TAXON_ID=37642 ORGANISM="Paraphysomonas imperforata, Strain PA2" /NCGR_SAMPLE_ID=MMETSP0103 /ASSEMBLY_ACC=CAM_ASM_000201 /LENGTH=554 /DNA_ID=CAMNT_0001587627 /DNA_START=26 /DNA_END=1690 /DNA_ORIENTATION=-
MALLILLLWLSVVAAIVRNFNVTIYNTYDFEVFVYFDTGSSGRFMFQLSSKMYAIVDTLLDHKYYVKQYPTAKEVLCRFKIQANSNIVNLQDKAKKRSEVQLNIAHGVNKTSLFSHPLITALPELPDAALGRSIKLRSLHSRGVVIYYDDGEDGAYMGTLQPGQETTITSYLGNEFFFVEEGFSKKRVGGSITVEPDKVLFLIHNNPDETDHALEEQEADPLLSSVSAVSSAEVDFGSNYLMRTGVPWLHHFGLRTGPRHPPSLYMWPAQRLGQTHSVTTPEVYWACKGAAKECRSPKLSSQLSLSLQLQVVSRTPRVFLIPDFLHTFEADHLVFLAKSRTKASSIGSFASGGVYSDETRTSRNAWLPRQTDPVTDTVFRRVADLLQIDARLMTSDANAEDMQVVHYQDGQRYEAHHDWSLHGYPESRFITVLLYLTDQAATDAGGETTFPRAIDCDDDKVDSVESVESSNIIDEEVSGNFAEAFSYLDKSKCRGKSKSRAFQVTPAKGQAVIFYNLLSDGNADDLTLHEALPVTKGEKWLANIWVWDPKMKIK